MAFVIKASCLKILQALLLNNILKLLFIKQLINIKLILNLSINEQFFNTVFLLVSLNFISTLFMPDALILLILPHETLLKYELIT